MENKQQQSAEKQLREIAEKAGMTLRELVDKFHIALIDDEKHKIRMVKNQEVEQQYINNQLMSLQYRNETISNQLLTYRLERKLKWMKRYKAVSGWLKRSPKQPKS